MFLSNDSSGAKVATLTPDEQLDARGLACPMPLLKAKLALNALGQGQLLEVLATDQGSVRDFQSFCDLSAHHLLTSDTSGSEYRYIIQKG